MAGLEEELKEKAVVVAEKVGGWIPWMGEGMRTGGGLVFGRIILLLISTWRRHNFWGFHLFLFLLAESELGHKLGYTR